MTEAATKETNLMAESVASNVRWVGPYQLRHLLENCMNDGQPWPPESNGVYVVSKRAWNGVPAKNEEILYVGSNTSKSPLFVIRVGSLIADLLGFFTNDYGHHSGGQSLWYYCRDNHIHPLDLYLGWVEGVPCTRCAEREVYDALKPLRSKKAPAGCYACSPPHRVCFPGSI